MGDRSIRVWRWFASALAALTAAAPGSPSSAPALTPWLTFEDVLYEWIGPRQTREGYVEGVMASVRRTDTEGDGLDAQDITRRSQDLNAQARARNVASVLANDLNGDLVVTRAELEARLSLRVKGRPVGDLSVAAFDTDADGVITLAEVVSVSSQEVEANSDLVSARALFALGPARDGRLTLEELRAEALAIFATADADGDGTISLKESQPYFRRSQARRQNMPPGPITCELPRLSGRPEILLVGMDHAAGRGPPGARHEVIVNIEPGRRRLYVILTSGAPVAWRFVGDVRRVSQAVVMSRRLQDGDVETYVSGLPDPRFQVRAGRGCIEAFGDVSAPKARWAVTATRDLLGRAPDAVFAQETASDISLPSGAFSRDPHWAASAQKKAAPSGAAGSLGRKRPGRARDVSDASHR